jgi:hypothetical protein
MQPTREQFKAMFELMSAIAEVIRTKGEVPSGELYAMLMGKIDLRTYEAILSRIKGSGLVEEKNHLLKWVGPNKF